MSLDSRVARACRRVLLLPAAVAWLFLVAASSMTADEPAAQARPPAAPAAALPPADYVGSDTCLGCHEDANSRLPATAHGRAAHPGSPAAARGCESCHGPGSRHIEDPSDDRSIRKFARMAPRDVSATCRSCHTSSTHALWEGSTHDARNLSCVSCHAVHTPAGGPLLS